MWSTFSRRNTLQALDRRAAPTGDEHMALDLFDGKLSD
jgi:hypothetical protein